MIRYEGLLAEQIVPWWGMTNGSNGDDISSPHHRSPSATIPSNLQNKNADRAHIGTYFGTLTSSLRIASIIPPPRDPRQDPRFGCEESSKLTEISLAGKYLYRQNDAMLDRPFSHQRSLIERPSSRVPVFDIQL
jgi:hypothetical protein